MNYENVYINSYIKLPISSKIYIFDKINKNYPNHNEQFYLVKGLINCFFSHFHEAIELIHIRSGRLECEVNGKKYTAYPGDILIFNPYNQHFGYMADETDYVEYQCICAELDKLFPTSDVASNNTISGIINGSMVIENFIDHSDPCAEIIAEYMQKIHDFYSQQNITPGAEDCLVGYMYIITGMLAGSRHVHSAPINTKIGSFEANILSYIEANYQSEMTSESVARKFSYNPSYFCRLFKQTFGKTFHHYLTEYRIDRAKTDFHELINSKKISSLADLAAYVGFSDYCYFARSFKKYTGLTPSDYFTIPAE